MKDLTKGNPFKLLILFTLPIYLGGITQQLYNMVDAAIVGNTVNSNALTGVGITGSVSFLILGAANGLTSGFGVCIAQRFGAGNPDEVRRSVAMSCMLSAIVATVLTAIAVPLTAPLLRLMNTGSMYFDYAYWYLMTIFCGIAATMLYNLGAAILRAVGDSVAPLVFLIVAACLNCGFDFLFIVAFKMQYCGAALATVISQLLSGIACFIYIYLRYPSLRLKRSDFAWNWRLAGGHVAIGLPMAMQFSITAVGCIVQQTALNGLEQKMLGVATAYAAASKIDTLANQCFAALGVAIANYTGQNSGAGRDDRVRKGVFAGMIYVLIFAVCGFAFCNGLCTPLMKIFINADKSGNIDLDAVFAYGREYLFFQSAGYVFLGTIFIFRNTLQGVGKSAVTMLSGLTELIARVVASLGFVSLWGFRGICLSNPFAWVCADVFLILTYCILLRHKKHRQSAGIKPKGKRCTS